MSGRARNYAIKKFLDDGKVWENLNLSDKKELANLSPRRSSPSNSHIKIHDRKEEPMFKTKKTVDSDFVNIFPKIVQPLLPTPFSDTKIKLDKSLDVLSRQPSMLPIIERENS